VFLLGLEGENPVRDFRSHEKPSRPAAEQRFDEPERKQVLKAGWDVVVRHVILLLNGLAGALEDRYFSDPLPNSFFMNRRERRGRREHR
jgi:hypothetical protein